MLGSKQKLQELLELVNTYPSPHNGQPIRLKVKEDSQLEILFDKSRGLQAADISLIFSFVTMGIFIEYLETCARALGHTVSVGLDLPKEQELKGRGTVKFARVKIKWNACERNKELLSNLAFRQTSRKKYSSGLKNHTSSECKKIASAAGMNLVELNDTQARETVWLNQRAVFDDLFDDRVRDELKHWLRFDERQKTHTKDGLAYDCMELNGPLLRFIVEHRGVLRIPGLSWLLKKYYLRTMQDKSSVFYMLAPFKTEQDAFEVGRVTMKLWLRITEDRKYIHPFGTIMSNKTAHQDFLRLAGISNETRSSSYLVFIFRAGASQPPSRSLRRPVEQHLILENV